jgi:hypothetical protein
MKSKRGRKWLWLFIVLLPSSLWLILETSTVNSKRLPYYGPKRLVQNRDTVFYRVNDVFYNHGASVRITPNKIPAYALMFLDRKYRTDSYRIGGLWEYLNYRVEKIRQIPFIFVTGEETGRSDAEEELQKLRSHENLHFVSWPLRGYDSLEKSYFRQKPYYVDYSFFVLIDEQRHIRGYYDGRYASELKRLIDEYRHLRLKEEKRRLADSLEIRQTEHE